MRFFDLLIMSINNLRRRKLRTGLTVLGVVIGTASIVVMVSLGIGLKENTVESYAPSEVSQGSRLVPDTGTSPRTITSWTPR